MKKLTRLGTIILTLGLSFAMLAVVRGGNTDGPHTFISSIQTKEWTTLELFGVPRDFKLEIKASVGFNIKLSDPSNVTIMDVENATDSYTLHLEKRGTYTLSIYNPSNSTITAQIDYTFYNVEADIIQTSIIMIISGTAIIIAPHLHHILKNKRENRKCYPTDKGGVSSKLHNVNGD